MKRCVAHQMRCEHIPDSNQAISIYALRNVYVLFTKLEMLGNRQTVYKMT